MNHWTEFYKYVEDNQRYYTKRAWTESELEEEVENKMETFGVFDLFEQFEEYLTSKESP